VYYSTLLSVAYGKSAREAALDGQIIKARQLEDIAGK
jgi:heterodisulfide reductase subunit B